MTCISASGPGQHDCGSEALRLILIHMALKMTNKVISATTQCVYEVRSESSNAAKLALGWKVSNPKLRTAQIGAHPKERFL